MMNFPDIRAALKGWDTAPTATSGVYVHGVSLNERRWHRATLRRLRLRRRDPIRLGSWPVVEAICGRRVQLVYAMPFQPKKEDNPCPECAELMHFLPWDPEQLPEQAQRIRQRVQQQERHTQEQWRLEQEQRDAYRKAERILEGADEFYQEDPSADLMELVERADRDDPDASRTG
jgi:hypothetical protein